LVLGLLALTGNGAAATPFFDFYGYSFLEGPPFSIGTQVTVAARFDPTQPEAVLPLDLEANEVTVLLEDLVITSVDVAGPILIVNYEDGGLELFEDPAKNSVWQVDPPNALVPARFTDGTLILKGVFTSCSLIFDTLSGVGTVEGSVTWTAGTRLGELVEVEDWYFFGGVTTQQIAGIPQGYDMAWDPQLIQPSVPVATQSTTWGSIKSLYRGTEARPIPRSSDRP
jgi:hypothetical protein